MTSKRSMESLIRRRDFLRANAQNNSAKTELAALNWAIYQLSAMMAERQEIQECQRTELLI